MNRQTLINALHNMVRTNMSERNLRVSSIYRNRLGIDEYLLKTALNIPQTLYRYAYLLNNADFCERASRGQASRSLMTQQEPNTTVVLYYEQSIRDMSITHGSLEAYAHSPLGLPTRMQTAYIPGNVEVCIINHRNTELFEANTAALTEAPNTARATTAEEIRLTSTPNTHVRMFKTTPPNDAKTTYHILTVGLNSDVIKRLRHVLYADTVRAIENKAQTTGPEGAFETKLVELIGLLNSENFITHTHNWLDMRNHETITAMLFTTMLAEIEQRILEQQRARINETINNLPDVRLTTLRQTLNDKKELLQRYESQYANALSDYEYAYNQFYAAKYSENEANAEIKTFLTSLGDKLLDVWTNDAGNVLKIFANNQCTFFNPELMKPYLQNPRSELRTQPVWVYNLIVELFYKKTYKLKMTVGFALNLISGEISTVSETTSSPMLRWDAHTGLPNPHHEFYNCWGDNKIPIREAVQKGKITEALMIAYAATAGIKLTDTAVFSRMLQYLRNANEHVLDRPCLIDPAGNVITIHDYKSNNSTERISYE